MAGGSADPSQPPSSDPASSARAPLKDNSSEAIAPMLADVSVAACEQPDLAGAPSHAEADTAEAASAATATGAAEQHDGRDEQVWKAGIEFRSASPKSLMCWQHQAYPAAQ